jgi:hypothetical protein
MSDHASDDRRGSRRLAMRFRIRKVGSQDSFDSRDGNISLGGFAWHGAALSVGTHVEAAFRLPGHDEEFLVRGLVLNVSYGARGTSAHVRFVDLAADVEQHLARYLEEVEQAES